MLKHTFFTFTGLQTEGDLLKTNIGLNGAHPIFEGHFPGEPILPGVCMMQIVKEMVEVHLNIETRLVKADDLKFLSFIRPSSEKLIQMELKINVDNESVRVDARLLDNAIILFKFKGTFVLK